MTDLRRLPLSDRAKAARALLDSLDDDGDADAEQAQANELTRRRQALHADQVTLIGADEALVEYEDAVVYYETCE